MYKKLCYKQNTDHKTADRKPMRATPQPIMQPLSTGLSGASVLRRQTACACGGGCPRCQNVPLLQTKLKIGEPGDQYEREADRVAGEVMRMPEPAFRHQSESKENEKIVQKKSSSPTRQKQVPPIIPEVFDSPGEPLGSDTRNFMESRFGQDFSRVRIHTDEKAAESARSVNALAYTVGQNIAFAKNQYAPQTQAGLKLLAHELTHTIQQSGSLDKRVSQTPISLQRQCSPPSDSELEGSAGGCAPLGATEKQLQDIGIAAEKKIVENDKINKDMLRGDAQPKIPRASKKLMGSTCPASDIFYGQPDLSLYKSPTFHLAEIKPVSQRSVAEQEYIHYARRISELVARMLSAPHNSKLCPDQLVMDADIYFDEDYFGRDLFNKIEVIPSPATTDMIPSSPTDTGIFVGNPLTVLPKNLFFCNLENGGVIYWCKDTGPKREDDTEREETPTDCPAKVEGGATGTRLSGGICRYEIPKGIPSKTKCEELGGNTPSPDSCQFVPKR